MNDEIYDKTIKSFEKLASKLEKGKEPEDKTLAKALRMFSFAFSMMKEQSKWKPLRELIPKEKCK